MHNKDLWGPLGVFRVMFGSTIFYTLFSLIMIGVKSSSDGRAGIQNGFWGCVCARFASQRHVGCRTSLTTCLSRCSIKFLMLVGLSTAAFFIPNEFFLKAWGWVGLFGGFFFLLIQVGRHLPLSCGVKHRLASLAVRSPPFETLPADRRS